MVCSWLTSLSVLRNIARQPLPERRNRVNPRVVKQKMSKFLKKRQKHCQWPQPEISFREAVAVIGKVLELAPKVTVEIAL